MVIAPLAGFLADRYLLISLGCDEPSRTLGCVNAAPERVRMEDARAQAPFSARASVKDPWQISELA
jgi:hypothetical protein